MDCVDLSIAFMADNEGAVVGSDGHRRGTQELAVFVVVEDGSQCMK
jgi:hypothetical protein